MLDVRMVKEQEKFPWPENYYMETDGKLRGEILEDQLKVDSSEENQLRKKIWDKRYQYEKGKYTGVDYYMKVLNQGEYLLRQKNSIFGKRAFRKAVEELRDVLQFDACQKNQEYEKLWYDEYVNFWCFYIEICRRDHTYSSVLFNIGKISESGLGAKIAADLVGKTVKIPKELDLVLDYQVLAKAAKHSYLYYYPQEEEYYDKLVKLAEE